MEEKHLEELRVGRIEANERHKSNHGWIEFWKLMYTIEGQVHMAAWAAVATLDADDFYGVARTGAYALSGVHVMFGALLDAQYIDEKTGRLRMVSMKELG